MTTPVKPTFVPFDSDLLGGQKGRIAVLVDGDAPRTLGARRLDRLMRGALSRFMASEAFGKLKPGEAADLAWPTGLAAEVVQVVRLPRRASQIEARKAGGAIGRAVPKDGCLVVADGHPRAADVAFGLTLRAYDFAAHKTGDKKDIGPVALMVAAPEAVGGGPCRRRRPGRGRVLYPRSGQRTLERADHRGIRQPPDRAAKVGRQVEVLEEKDLAKLGMRLLLGVGQGSESPSKVVVMQWKGGADEAPLALVGKGVVFDTGGISIKPAGGMEDMTMDMGGAGVVRASCARWRCARPAPMSSGWSAWSRTCPTGGRSGRATLWPR